MRAPLLPVALAVAAGIIVHAYVPVHMIAVAAGALLSVIFMACANEWVRRNIFACLPVLTTLLLWTAVGILRAAAWEAQPALRLSRVLPDKLKAIKLHGIVIEDMVEPFEPPTRDSDESLTQPGASEVNADRAQQRYISDERLGVIEVRHMREDREWVPVKGRLRIKVSAAKEELLYGDEILVEGRWQRVQEPSNPGQYDLAAALKRRRITGILRIAAYDGLMVVNRNQGNPVLKLTWQLRRHWIRLLEQALGAGNATLLTVLTIGGRAAIDEDLQEAFRQTGTLHLLVVSGFHVGLIAVLIELLLRLVGLQWRLRLGISAVGLLAYSLITGTTPSVWRAALMSWIMIGAMALDRPVGWPNVMAAAALAILLIHPAELFDPGLILSFGSVISLLGLAGPLDKWFNRLGAFVRPALLRRFIAGSLAATVAIWIGLGPLLAHLTYLVSPISVLANLVLVPLTSLVTLLGVFLLLAALIFEPIITWSSGLLIFLIQFIQQCVRWFQSIPGGFFFTAPPPVLWLIVYYGLLIATPSIGQVRSKRPALILCWLGALVAWIWIAVYTTWQASRWLIVDVIDVGHGDSLLLRLPRGPRLLVDTGTQQAGRARVLPFLHSQGIRSLDALVLTHPDEDHIGGAMALFDKLSVRRLLTNGASDDTLSSRGIQQRTHKLSIPVSKLSAGAVLTGGQGCRIDVLHPPEGFVPGTDPASNDNSLVMRVTKGKVSFLLTADLEEEGIPAFLQQPQSARATVLKVPHHGSRLGESGRRLIKAVIPDLAVLSVGTLHGLPSKETMELLRDAGVPVYATREQGALRLMTDGKRLVVKTLRRRPRTLFLKDES